MSKYRTHLLIPDTQVRPGVPINHLQALGELIVHKKPDVIIQIGDWADMHSLSSYDRGTKNAEGARYQEDIRAASNAMELLMRPLVRYNKDRRVQKKKQYTPEMHLTLGNHEQRIERHVLANPLLDGKLSYNDLGFGEYGWKVHPFLEVVEIDGVRYSHYFPRNADGRIVQTRRGATRASVQVQREGKSASSGHLQGVDFHVQQRGDRRDYGIIAGSFYMHEEEYLSPQGTEYWRGVVWKNEVFDGQYDPMFLSLDYILRRYGDRTDYYA